MELHRQTPIWIGYKPKLRELEGILYDFKKTKEFLDSWRSDDDIVCILTSIYGIETTKGELNRFFAKKYDHIGLENAFECTFCHCHYVWNVGKKEMHEFYLFAGKKRESHTLLASHQMAVSGSRPLMNTKPITG